MPTIKTSELIGRPLDWAVAKCESLLDRWGVCAPVGFRPSTDWLQGGPIIERTRMGLEQFTGHPCRAYIGTPAEYSHAMWAPEGMPLLAFMRCYVASVLGDEVEVPEGI